MPIYYIYARLNDFWINHSLPQADFSGFGNDPSGQGVHSLIVSSLYVPAGHATERSQS